MKTPKEGIVVDGSTRGNPGPSEYRGINLANGQILFHKKIGIATNNICEFIALGHGILYALNQNKDQQTVYTDSQTAMSWIKRKFINSKLPESPRTEIARDYTERILLQLKKIPVVYNGIDLIINNQITVTKWYSSEYGEIPADFGYKK